MPEMTFTVSWPDGTEQECYSPSTIVREYLRQGEAYPAEDFLRRSRVALRIAGERVRARYGFECTSARQQLEDLEAAALRHGTTGEVTVVRFG